MVHIWSKWVIGRFWRLSHFCRMLVRNMSLVFWGVGWVPYLYLVLWIIPGKPGDLEMVEKVTHSLCTLSNKKVILCERKRHTAVCIASACYAALMVGGNPSRPGWGDESDITIDTGELSFGIPTQPSQQMEFFHAFLSSLDGVTPPHKGGRTDTCENITSRHPSDAGGNND